MPSRQRKNWLQPCLLMPWWPRSPGMDVDKLMLYMPCALMINRVCHLAVIPGTIILVPYHVVKYLKLIYLKLRSHMRGAVAGGFWYVIFNLILVIDGWGICCDIALIWMSIDFTDDLSALVQVMAWCHQATSHYLSKCWPRSLSLYGVTRPEWVI